MRSKFQKNFIFNSNSSVLIASFSVHKKGKIFTLNGMIDSLLSFFLSKTEKTVLIDQPYPGSDIIFPIIKIYKKEKLLNVTRSSIFLYFLYPFLKLANYHATHVSFKIRDFLSVIFYGFSEKTRFDVFIGLEGINALAGIMLKKLGKVNIVIYYVSDYSPSRYGQTFFNKLYLFLDRFCVTHADFTWDVSPVMKDGRIKAGILPIEMHRVIHVPNGLFKEQIDPLPISKRTRDSIVYMGALDKVKGIDIALKALKIILAKRPKTTLHIIGGTENEIVELQQFACILGIEKSIIFYGFIPPNKIMSNIIRRCYIGVGTYGGSKSPPNRYGDSGKIRQYLGCGLPIVATTLQWYTKYAIEKGAGIGVKETSEDFARGIITLLEDDALYKSYSKKAVELSKHNTWENSYANAFHIMDKLKKAQ